MIVINVVCGNIEASKLDLEATIEMKLDEIKSDHVKTIDSLNMKNQLSHQTNLLRLINKHLLI